MKVQQVAQDRVLRPSRSSSKIAAFLDLVRNIEDYLKVIRTASERWQEEDWRTTECDEEYSC